MKRRDGDAWALALPTIVLALVCGFMAATSFVRGAGEDGTGWDRLVSLVLYGLLALALGAVSVRIVRSDGDRRGSRRRADP